VNVPEPDAAAKALTARDRSRARIVAVAASLLAAGGRDAVSTRAVALAAGTQAPAIYRLFGDKDGLLEAVAEYGFAAYLARKPALGASGDPVADLRVGWDRHIAFGLENPALFSLMNDDAAGTGRRSPAALASYNVLRKRIRAIAAAGRLRVSEQLGADMLHAAGSGAVLALLATPESERSPQLSTAMFDAVAAAIATPGPAVEGASAGPPAAPGVVLAANTVRAGLSGLTALSPGERHVLGEWLDRVVAAPAG
jgi:AcrR family transcriptional regulator